MGPCSVSKWELSPAMDGEGARHSVRSASEVTRICWLWILTWWYNLWCWCFRRVDRWRTHIFLCKLMTFSPDPFNSTETMMTILNFVKKTTKYIRSLSLAFFTTTQSAYYYHHVCTWIQSLMSQKPFVIVS